MWARAPDAKPAYTPRTDAGQAPSLGIHRTSVRRSRRQAATGRPRDAAVAEAERSRPCARRAPGCGWRSARPARCSRTTRAGLVEDLLGGGGSRLPVGSSARTGAARWPARGRSRPAAARRRRAAPADGRAARLRPSRPAARARAPAPRAARTAGDHLRQRRRSPAPRIRQQVVELVDEADVARGGAGCARRRPGRRTRRPVDRRPRRRSRPLQQAGDVQQGRLAGAGRADQGDDLARRAATRSMPLQHVERAPGLGRSAGGCRSAPAARHRLTHSAAPRPDRAGPPARPDRAWRGTTGAGPWRPRSARRRDRPWRAAATGSGSRPNSSVPVRPSSARRIASMLSAEGEAEHEAEQGADDADRWRR